STPSVRGVAVRPQQQRHMPMLAFLFHCTHILSAVSLRHKLDLHLWKERLHPFRLPIRPRLEAHCPPHLALRSSEHSFHAVLTGVVGLPHGHTSVAVRFARECSLTLAAFVIGDVGKIHRYRGSRSAGHGVEHMAGDWRTRGHCWCLLKV